MVGQNLYLRFLWKNKGGEMKEREITYEQFLDILRRYFSDVVKITKEDIDAKDKG